MLYFLFIILVSTLQFTIRSVHFLPDCVGLDVESSTANPQPDTIFLLENLRFHLEEEGKGKNELGESVKHLTNHKKVTGEFLGQSIEGGRGCVPRFFVQTWGYLRQ